MKTFLGPGDTLAVPDPTYSLYPVLAELDEVKFVTVPWDKDWSLPTDELLAAKPKAIFLANPNAPSGTMVSPQKLEELASSFKGAAADRRGLCRLRGRQLPSAGPQVRERRHLPHALQGVFAGRVALRLRRRAGVGHSGDEQGEGYLSQRRRLSIVAATAAHGGPGVCP